MSLVVRTPGSAAAIVPLVRRAIWSVDKDQAIVRVATMSALLSATAAERRFVLILFEAFALAALVLAAAGIYGVLAGSVAERTREIGVRSALGASRRDILGMVVGQGMTLTAVGVAIGIAGAVAATRALAAMLFDISRLDPVTYLAGDRAPGAHGRRGRGGSRVARRAGRSGDDVADGVRRAVIPSVSEEPPISSRRRASLADSEARRDPSLTLGMTSDPSYSFFWADPTHSATT